MFENVKKCIIYHSVRKSYEGIFYNSTELCQKNTLQTRTKCWNELTPPKDKKNQKTSLYTSSVVKHKHVDDKHVFIKSFRVSNKVLLNSRETCICRMYKLWLAQTELQRPVWKCRLEFAIFTENRRNITVIKART